ncbi:MAG: hypothetical protein K1X53_18080 [Candidatus Sumerlaeaceae bacterium]|nr:hypothetical protein [Candidatus Sumerlaeaceae bacterium]
MDKITKLEIITDSLEMKEVIAVLESEGLPHYTLIRDVVGRGSRGFQGADDLSDAFTNSYLLTTCNADQVERVVAALRPLLKEHGGVCLVSEARWVLH